MSFIESLIKFGKRFDKDFPSYPKNASWRDGKHMRVHPTWSVNGKKWIGTGMAKISSVNCSSGNFYGKSGGLVGPMTEEDSRFMQIAMYLLTASGAKRKVELDDEVLVMWTNTPTSFEETWLPKILPVGKQNLDSDVEFELGEHDSVVHVAFMTKAMRGRRWSLLSYGEFTALELIRLSRLHHLPSLLMVPKSRGTPTTFNRQNLINFIDKEVFLVVNQNAVVLGRIFAVAEKIASLARSAKVELPRVVNKVLVGKMLSDMQRNIDRFGQTEKWSGLKRECNNLAASLISQYDQSEQLPMAAMVDFHSGYWNQKNLISRMTSQHSCRTNRGEWVRSLGELYLSNAMFQHGIEYRYELPLHLPLGDMPVCSPDWTLPDDSVVEYLGTAHSLPDPAWERKKSAYELNGVRCHELHYQNTDITFDQANEWAKELALSLGAAGRVRWEEPTLTV